MKRQCQEEKTKVFYIIHISTFVIATLPTLDVKKILCPHKLDYSESTVPAVWICGVGRKSRETTVQYIISCREGYHEKIHATAVTNEIEMSFFFTAKCLANSIQLVLVQVIFPAVIPMRTQSIKFCYKLNVNYFSTSMKFTQFCIKKKLPSNNTQYNDLYFSTTRRKCLIPKDSHIQ